MRRSLFIVVFWCVVLGCIGIALMGGGLEYDETDVVVIRHSDTLWGVASDVAGNTHNVNAVVYEIRELNDMDDVSVRRGDEIKVPVLEGGE